MSIKTNFEFPRGESDSDLLTQGQRLSQDLSKNFKSIKKQLGITGESVTPVSLDGAYVTQGFSAPSGTLFASYTIAHGLGVVPTSFIVSDIAFSSGSLGALSYSLFRLSWTATDITVRLNITTGTGTAFAGSFKLLVLR